jgi:hypothetical protein
MAGLTVRPFCADDAAQVAALQGRIYPTSGWRSEAECAAYLREVLLRNPWVDPDVPSWVAEERGCIIGFVGVIPRRMRIAQRVLRVAVGCRFMVDPAKRASFAAIALLRKYFSGPQDLCIADGANDAARLIWEAAGGAASPLHTLHWVKLLRPMQGAIELMAERPRLRPYAALARPFAALADACTPWVRRERREAALAEEPLGPAALVEALLAQPAALRPEYDRASLEWLLAQVARKPYGSLQGCLLRETSGQVAGWFLYYLNRRMSQVLQLGGRADRLPGVLEQLFEHARARGSVAIHGRLEPHMAAALPGKRCLLQRRGMHMLLYAREPSLLLPFYNGRAFFTRLEGEWWTHGTLANAAAMCSARGRPSLSAVSNRAECSLH